MPAFPSLAPALAFLQSAQPVQITQWSPAPGPRGLASGAWGAPANLAKPYVVDVPSGSAARIQLSGGEVITADLTVYCRSAAAPSEPAAGGREPRVTWQGRRYRVLARRDIQGHPFGAGTVALLCVADNGGEA